MNRTIKLLMFSDLFLLTGFGLFSPILAIFIKENIVGGTIFAAGFATFIFWVTKSIIQLPLSRYVDAHDHKIKFLILGTAIITIVPFVYIFAKSVNHIYLAQILYGIGSGLAYPCWLGLWSTNLDKHHESFEWSLYSTLVGVSAAAAAAIGATIAQFAGFATTFTITGFMAIIGAIVLFGLEKKAENKKQIRAYNTKRKLSHHTE